LAHELVIRTSEQGWFAALAKAYKDRIATLVIDDANVGLDLEKDNLFDVGRKARLSAGEITATGIALGMSSVGIGILIAAFFDPEPTSKLTLLVSGGIVLVATGGLTAVYILTGKRPPNVSVTQKGFEISWPSNPA
jgi:hypothetical protein